MSEIPNPDTWPEGDQDKDHYCAYAYKQAGRRCPNPVDFAIKVPDGRGGDWRKAQLSCYDHLAEVTCQVMRGHHAKGPVQLAARRDWVIEEMG